MPTGLRLGLGLTKVGSGFPLAAPTLTWTTGTTDSTPGLDVAFADGAVQLDDVVRVQFATSLSFASPVEGTATVDATAVSNLDLTYDLPTPLDDGTWYCRARTERSGVAITAWSNVETKTIDAVPVITSSATDNVDENLTLSHALTSNQNVTWSIVGGADQAQFELSGSTLRWVSNGTQDYENPLDSDANNTYVVTVRATAVADSETADQTITVTVNNVADTSGIVISNVANASDSSDLSTYTFASLSFGTAASDRILAVAIATRNASGDPQLRDPSTSVTIGGVTATKLITAIPSGEGGLAASEVGIWAAAVPTGTSGDVVVALAGSATRMGVSLYELTGGNSLTPADTDTDTDKSNPQTASIDCPAGGAVIAVVINANTSSYAWSGLTEDYDHAVESTVIMSSAHEVFASAQTGLSVSATATGGTPTLSAVLAAVSLTPA